MSLASNNVPNGATIFDLVNKFYGSMDYLTKFLSDNPQLSDGADFDYESNPNTAVHYDAAFVSMHPLKLKAAEKPPATQYFIARDGQSLFDVCLMTYGTIDRYNKLLSDNSINGLTIGSLSGKAFIFDSSLRSDGMLSGEISRRELFFSTFPENLIPAVDFVYRITTNGRLRVTTDFKKRITA